MLRNLKEIFFSFCCEIADRVWEAVTGGVDRVKIMWTPELFEQLSTQG
jgi:hypothetical protein